MSPCKQEQSEIGLVYEGTIILKLIVIDSFPIVYVSSQRQEKGGGIYDRKQVYPKVAQTERPIRH